MKLNFKHYLNFNSDGYEIITQSSLINHDSGGEYVSWTFRKAPGFFDVVTYSGTGSAQNISHSLGSVPGMIIIHCRDGTHDWEVYHRATGATKSLHLNKTDAEATDSTVWNNTTPTSSVFTIGTSSNVNQNGHGYVAYVFAHDEQAFGTDEDEAIIKCGSYTGTGSANNFVNVGFEPQFLLTKSAGGNDPWSIVDVMRGMSIGSDMSVLRPNYNSAEYTDNTTYPTSTGFNITNTGGLNNDNGRTYIYMAIRRSHKSPTAGTEVFAMDTGSSSSTTPTWDSGFTVDMSFVVHPNSGSMNNMSSARLLGRKLLYTNNTDAEAANSSFTWDSNVGWGKDYNNNAYSYMYRRAPGFLDVVAYTGTGSNGQAVNHNLGVTPEMIIVKSRSGNGNWFTYHTGLSSGNHIKLNQDYAQSNDGGAAFALTSTTITFDRTYVSNINTNTVTYVAYLFATLDGISKVGSYTGTGANYGNSVNVDCGFTAGARFVMIKRIDSGGDWYFWDTLHGIVSGNDPYSLINSYAAQVTNTDYIDPLNAGFTVTSSAPAALNTSGGTYLFLAIA